MTILVLYFKIKSVEGRNTIDEHLYSFRRYVRDVDFHYYNAVNGIPWYLTLSNYDGVILHYTFLATRWSPDFFKGWCKSIKNLKRIKGYKVAIPQDEYAETDILIRIFKDYDIKTVFTCFSEDQFDKAYPAEKTSLEHRMTVLPGYIDQNAIKKVEKICRPQHKRSIDLGYRARNMPFWLGRHGQLKYELGKIFMEKTSESQLTIDISTQDKDAYLGDEWYKFLCRCRAVLGCEGGASLLDPTGAIRIKVEDFVRKNPKATFEEVEKNCFPNQDNNIQLFTISPRHFECAITKTCQVLVEGNYNNILLPGVHYIEVKRDFSNIEQVVSLLLDKDFCANITENVYEDIVQSKQYTYKFFAKKVISHIKQKTVAQGITKPYDQKLNTIIGSFLNIREQFEPIMVKIYYPWIAIKIYRFKTLVLLWHKIKKVFLH